MEMSIFIIKYSQTFKDDGNQFNQNILGKTLPTWFIIKGEKQEQQKGLAAPSQTHGWHINTISHWGNTNENHKITRIRTAKRQKQTGNTQVPTRMHSNRNSFSGGRDAKLQSLGKGLAVSYKVKYTLTIRSTIPLLRIYPNETKTKGNFM